MKNFTTWALSQFDSLVNALAKNSRVQEDFRAEGSGNSCNTGFIADLLKDLETGSTDAHVDGISLGNFVFLYDIKTRKTSIINMRSNKFVTTYCNPKDTMSAAVGFGVCWAKYNNVERPKYPVTKWLSELKPHDIFQMYRKDCKYEFIGTTTKGDAPFVAFGLHENKTKDFFTFFDDTCTVWE